MQLSRRWDVPLARDLVPSVNLQLATHVKNLAQRKGCSPAQLALAWALAQGEDIVPIPGTKRLRMACPPEGQEEVCN